MPERDEIQKVVGIRLPRRDCDAQYELIYDSEPRTDAEPIFYVRKEPVVGRAQIDSRTDDRIKWFRKNGNA